MHKNHSIKIATFLLFALFPALARAVDMQARPLVVFDLSDELRSLNPKDPKALRRHYDEVLLVTCLQGLVNRNEPQLFVRYNQKSDDFWFEKMTEPGSWMPGRKVKNISSLSELLAEFPISRNGLVVWDEQVPATSNVAATVAGVEDLLAVRYDESEGSLFRELTSEPVGLKIVRRLLNEDGSALFTGRGMVPETTRKSSGSAKSDAYIWLLERYIKPQKTNPLVIGFYLDGFWLKCWQASDLENHTLNNLDYIIAHRGAILDFNVWEDEATVDDPKQAPGTDLKTFREILMACVENTKQKEMIAVFGFVSWAHKYTNVTTNGWHAGGTHPDVATEWKWIEILSAYNAFTEPDALGYSSFPNASFYRHFPVPAVVAQNATPTREKLIQEGVLDSAGRLLPVNYYAHHQGDYDCAAWVYRHFPDVLSDSARGTLPLSWAINPNLAARFAFGIHYIRSHSAAKEIFVAGEAAGYLNPSLLQSPRPNPGLPDALDLWVAHNQKWYRQWDIDVTAFNVDGNTPMMNDRAFAAYVKFSPGGLGSLRAPSAFGVRENLPYIQMNADLPGHMGSADMGETVRTLNSLFEVEVPHFVLVRSILQLPSYYAEIQKRLLEPGHLPNMLVDMPTLFWLIREYDSDPSYHPKRPSFADSASVMANPEKFGGLRTRRVGDGAFKIEKTDARTAWIVAGGGARYLYFDVADDFSKAFAAGHGGRLRVTYLDAAPGALGVDYDSSDSGALVSGAFKAATPVTMSGSGKVEIAEFDLPDAIFSNRQGGSSDFRIHAGGMPLHILAVEVLKISAP